MSSLAMPAVSAPSPSSGALLSAGASSPQAARAKTITSARSRARNFFIFGSSNKFFYLKAHRGPKTDKKAAYVRTLRDDSPAVYGSRVETPEPYPPVYIAKMKFKSGSPYQGELPPQAAEGSASTRRTQSRRRRSWILSARGSRRARRGSVCARRRLEGLLDAYARAGDLGPASRQRVMSPSRAAPLARKSSMMSTRSPFPRYFLLTRMVFSTWWVKEYTLLVQNSPERFAVRFFWQIKQGSRKPDPQSRPVRCPMPL